MKNHKQRFFIVIAAGVALGILLLAVFSAAASSAPTADPGGPYSVQEGGSVQLDGTGSTDPDGYIANYSWSIAGGPGTLENGGTPMPTYIAPSVDSDTDVFLSLTVTDNAGDADTTLASLTVTNTPVPLENRLLDNFLKLRQDYYDFRENVRENYVRIENYENLKLKYEKLKGRVESLKPENYENYLDDLYALLENDYVGSGEFENFKDNFEGFKSTYYTNLDSIENDLNEIRGIWTTLAENVGRNSENIASLSSKISLLNGKVNRNLISIGKVENDLGALAKNMSTNAENILSLSSKISVLNGKVEDLKTRLGDLEKIRNNIDSLSSKITVLNDKAKELKSDLNALTGVRENISSLAGKISTLNSKLNDAKDDLSSLKESASSDIEEIRGGFKSLEENVADRFSTLENELSGEVLQEVETARNKLTSRIENSRRKFDGLVSGWGDEVGGLENKLHDVRVDFGSRWRDLDEKMDKERGENPWKIGSITSFLILGLVVGGFLAYAWKNDYFKQIISDENRGPELQIWAALNRLEHYYEQMEKHGAKIYRPKIEGQKETIRVLKEKYPEEYEKVVRNEDVAGLKESEEAHERRTPEEDERDVRGEGSAENR